MTKKGRIIYISAFLVLCLIPSAGLLMGGWEEPAKNEDRAHAPDIRLEDGRLNTQFLPQAGSWFEDNFAWRREIVTANAKLRAGIFKESAEDGVILGTDGWLYYKDSLNDYTGKDQLSDRALYDIARCAKITQDYCSCLGIDYLFTIAPNKATLYPEHMPYYFAHKVSDTSNRIRLQAFLEEEGVHYLDLTQVLEEEVQRRKESPAEDDVLPYLYHKRDSHWTAEGAAIAAEAILDESGTKHRSYADEKCTVKADFQGDLEAMLYPSDVTPEEEVYYDPAPSYTYTGEVESTFDYFIQTVSDGTGVSLLMYRDSFGNALLPFLAGNFAQCYFSRGVPYDLMFDINTYAPTVVVTENAERNLPDVASRAPILQSLPSGFYPDQAGFSEVPARITSESEDANPYFTRILGIPEEEPEAGTQYLADPGDGNLYEAMPVHLQENDEEAFILYLPADVYAAGKELEESVHVYVRVPAAE